MENIVIIVCYWVIKILNLYKFEIYMLVIKFDY